MPEPESEALNVTSTPDSVRLPRQEAVRPANCTSARETASFLPSRTKLAFRPFRGSFCTRPLALRSPARWSWAREKLAGRRNLPVKRVVKLLPASLATPSIAG